MITSVYGPVRARPPVCVDVVTQLDAHLVVPSHDIGSALSGLAGVGREAIGERDDEVAQFNGALDDERTVE